MTPTVGQALLRLCENATSLWLLKATFIAALGLLAAGLARARSAAVRHAILATTFAALLLLPLAALLAPSFHLAVPIQGQAAVAPPLLYAPAGSGASAPVSLPDVSPTAPPASVTTHLPHVSLVAAAEGLWLLGVAVFLLPIAAGLYEVRRIRRTGISWREGQALADEIALLTGSHRSVMILVHECIPGAMTFGVAKPAILLPVAARNWPPQDLRRALTHELEHVRRCDWLTHCLARSVCALYWFHPLVWMAWRRLTLHAECACDDAVLAQSAALPYADQLVSLAESDFNPRSAVPGLATRADLGWRIRAVMDEGRRRARAGWRWLLPMAAAAVLLVAAVAPAQLTALPQEAQLSFDAASVKPAGNLSGEQMQLSPGRLRANAPLRVLVQTAYGLQPFEIVGGPEWTRSDRYVVDATAAATSDRHEIMLMLRSLLADQFRLQTHSETRTMPVYNLVADRDGLRLPPAQASNCAAGTDVLGALADPGARIRIAPRGPSSPTLECGVPDVFLGEGGARIQGGDVSMAQLAQTLSRVLGAPVADRTHFSGTFDFRLDFLPDDTTPGLPPPPPGSAAASSAAPSLFSAVRTLGLRLQAGRGPVDVLVIDHAEKPEASAQERARAGDVAAPVARFDAASIKPCSGGGGRGVAGGSSNDDIHMAISCRTAADLIETAYVEYPAGKRLPLGVYKPLPIEGEPGWVKSDAFSIEATVAEPTTQPMMRGPMLQALLKDRFHLQMHQQSRQIPVYELRVAGSGLKLAPAAGGNCMPFDPDKPGGPAFGSDPDKNPVCGFVLGRRESDGTGTMTDLGATLHQFALWLNEANAMETPDGARMIDRPVIDATGPASSRTFDIRLKLLPEDLATSNGSQASVLMSQDALTAALLRVGLELVPAQGPGNVLVIDHIDRPSPN